MSSSYNNDNKDNDDNNDDNDNSLEEQFRENFYESNELKRRREALNEFENLVDKQLLELQYKGVDVYSILYRATSELREKLGRDEKCKRISVATSILLEFIDIMRAVHVPRVTSIFSKDFKMSLYKLLPVIKESSIEGVNILPKSVILAWINSYLIGRICPLTYKRIMLGHAKIIMLLTYDMEPCQ